MARIVFSVILLLAAATANPAFAQYRGPADPEIPADNQPIKNTAAACLTDTLEVIDWGEAENHKAADMVCKLRNDHLQARAELRKLISTFIRQHRELEESKKFAPVAESVRRFHDYVDICIKSFEGNQYCHNLACAVQPEGNAIFCDRQAATLVKQFVGQ